MPLSLQLDPHAVKNLRTMAGGRYDLVNRNNDIVLEYKKRFLLNLSLQSEVTAFEKQAVTVPVTIVSDNSIAKLEASAPQFIAAGGAFQENGVQSITLSLPAYDTTLGKNTYTMTVRAIDVQGNISDAKSLRIIVKQIMKRNGKMKGDFLPKLQTIYLHQQAPAIFSLTLEDKDGQPFETDVKNLQLAVHPSLAHTKAQYAAGDSHLKIGEFKAVKPGVYQIPIYAGSLPENVILKPSVKGCKLDLPESELDIVDGGEIDENASTFTVDAPSMKADGQDTRKLVFTARGIKGIPFSGAAQDLAFVYSLVAPNNADKFDANKDIQATPIIEEPAGSGVYVSSFTTHRTGVFTIKAYYKNLFLKSKMVEVTSHLGSNDFVIDPSKTVLKFDPSDEIVANGKDKAHVQFIIKDKYGNVSDGILQDIDLKDNTCLLYTSPSPRD